MTMNNNLLLTYNKLLAIPLIIGSAYLVENIYPDPVTVSFSDKQKSFSGLPGGLLKLLAINMVAGGLIGAVAMPIITLRAILFL